MSDGRLKVCVVGGGSTYTPELVDGLLRRRAALPIAELALVDRDERRLGVLGPYAQRMCDRHGGGIDVRWGTDLPAGVRGADFVVSQIRVGGQAARDRDEQLGREFGLIGQETVGVGGFANALRTIPVALDIAAVVEREAPGAILFNFTNPAGLITEALCRHRPVTTIGLCNVPWNFKVGIAAGLGVDAETIELDYVGLNHLSWVRGLRVGGEERLDAFVDGLVARSQRHVAQGREPEWHPDTIRSMRALPNPYLRYYYETGSMLAAQAAQPTRASQVMAIEASLLEQYADPALSEKPPELAQRGGAYYSETAAALMADIVAGAGTTHVVDVRNDGAIPGLDADVVVEVPARVDRRGAHALPAAALRPDMDALIRTVKDFELLTITAAVDGDHDAALLALITNPLGPPANRAPALWARLREVHRGWLGRLDG